MNPKKDANPYFYPYGPFEIPKSNRRIDKNSLKGFWDNVASDSDDENLPYAVGCYIFSIRTGGGTLPWYVGMAEKQPFRRECFSAHKLVHFNDALAERRGTPTLTLIAKFTPNDRYAQQSNNGHKDIQYLEKYLILLATLRNPDLKNIRDTSILKGLVVHGVLKTPRGGQASSVSELKNLLQLQ